MTTEPTTSDVKPAEAVTSAEIAERIADLKQRIAKAADVELAQKAAADQADAAAAGAVADQALGKPSDPAAAAKAALEAHSMAKHHGAARTLLAAGLADLERQWTARRTAEIRAEQEALAETWATLQAELVQVAERHEVISAALAGLKDRDRVLAQDRRKLTGESPYGSERLRSDADPGANPLITRHAMALRLHAYVVSDNAERQRRAAENTAKADAIRARTWAERPPSGSPGMERPAESVRVSETDTSPAFSSSAGTTSNRIVPFGQGGFGRNLDGALVDAPSEDAAGTPVTLGAVIDDDEDGA